MDLILKAQDVVFVTLLTFFRRQTDLIGNPIAGLPSFSRATQRAKSVQQQRNPFSNGALCFNSCHKYLQFLVAACFFS